MKRTLSGRAQDVLGSQARQGYFGQTADTASNASADGDGRGDGCERIVLSEGYGQTDHAAVAAAAAEAAAAMGMNGAPTATRSAETFAPPPEAMQGLSGRYAGKTVVVTGGSKGIGEGCTRIFFAAGSNVVVAAPFMMASAVTAVADDSSIRRAWLLGSRARVRFKEVAILISR